MTHDLDSNFGAVGIGSKIGQLLINSSDSFRFYRAMHYST